MSNMAFIQTAILFVLILKSYQTDHTISSTTESQNACSLDKYCYSLGFESLVRCFDPPNQLNLTGCVANSQQNIQTISLEYKESQVLNMEFETLIDLVNYYGAYSTSEIGSSSQIWCLVWWFLTNFYSRHCIRTGKCYWTWSYNLSSDQKLKSIGQIYQSSFIDSNTSDF